MTDIEKVGLGYASAMCSVLAGYWLNNSSANRKARRDHKTRLRKIRAAVPDSLNELPTKYLEDWWLGAIDDCGRLSRWRIERCLSEFRQLKFPPIDPPIKNEEEYTDERITLFRERFDDLMAEADKILCRILSAL